MFGDQQMGKWAFGSKQATSAKHSSIEQRIIIGWVERYNQDKTIAVTHKNKRYTNAMVLPQGWCSKGDKALMNLTLPPLGSPVLCLLDVSGSCFALCGFPLLGEKAYKELYEEQKSETETARFSIWKRIFSRKSGKLEILHDIDGAKLNLSIDPEDEKIEFTDFHENRWTIDKDKVEVENKGELKIKIDGDCKIEGGGKIAIEASEIEIGGNSKELVTHAELKAALDSVIAIIKGHTHITTATVSASPTPGVIAPSTSLASMQLDLSAAKAGKIKTS